MYPTGNPKSRTLCILRRFLSLRSKPNKKFCNFFHFRNKRLSSHIFLSSQTNNQVHRSPKYFPPLFTLFSELTLKPARLKVASCVLTSWHWRPQLGQPNRQYSSCKQMRQHLRRRDRTQGNGHDSIQSFPAAFPVTAAGEGQILSRSKLIVLLRLPRACADLHQTRTWHNLVHV